MPQIIEMKINFPTCQTCKYYASGQQPHTPDNPPEYYEICEAAIVDFDGETVNPGQFFCSEHTTQDGTKFVNYGTK